MNFRFNFTRTSALLVAGILVACDSGPSKISSKTVAAGLRAEGVKISVPEKISFNEHIQPILSENCYHCHGPDSGTREPKKEPLRLDRVADAFALREDGKPVIIKGNAKESILVKRIHEKDPDEMMPPPKSHKTLKPEEIAMIERWIEQGAEYEAHWSFVPVKLPEVPVAGKDWAVNPIDHFIAAKLDMEGIKPNPPEDVRRFHRRMTFDLTGLPPKPEDSDRFVQACATDAQKATEAEADRLLATTASAEHFARHWLDAARYADSHGIHIDNYRSIWPYRDWVINAFAKNMPWDQFTIEQIAGDLLPNATIDQQVATGFSRCLATTGEGGAIGEEYDAIYAKDRVDTTSAIWLGLTTGCASCHDHKFDPISQKDFYSLAAFFRNTPMSSLDGNNAEHPPNVKVTLPGDRARLAALPMDVSNAESQIANRKAAAAADFEKWLVTAAAVPPSTSGDAPVLILPLNEAEGPIHGLVDGQPREWLAAPNRIDGPMGKAPLVSDVPIDLGDVASFKRTDQVTYGGFIRVEGAPTGAVVARMNPGQGFKGWDLYLQNGQPASHVIDTWDSSANKVVASTPLPPGQWHHVMVTFDGSLPSAQTQAIYVDGVLQKAEQTYKTVGNAIETAVTLKLGAREGGVESKLNAPVALQDFRFYRRLLKPDEISKIANAGAIRQFAITPVAQRPVEDANRILDYFLSEVDATSRPFFEQLAALKAELAAIQARSTVSLVMAEKPGEPFAHILTRGAYASKGEKVAAGTPAVLPPMPTDAPKNRLGLAKWLVDPINPLPARVTMNRTWYYFFGTGIVESTEDFGVMGARPTHPQLLDWLASEFVSSKWDYRHMLKLIVTSSTYRESGHVAHEMLEKDPANKLMARGPRHRLDAEELRDLVLASSGLLVEKVGGPSVRPYQPGGIWEAVAMKESNTKDYTQDKGENLYRRSLYTFWKRTAAPASLEIFNAPTRESFCVRRDRTNTPLQALVVLNDPQFIEGSRVLAANAMAAAKDFDQRLDWITTRLIDRKFTAGEKAVVKKTMDAAVANYRVHPEDAKSLIATGEMSIPKDIDIPDLASWSVVASQIMNLDETLTH